jgi:hypothetical protein
MRLARITGGITATVALAIATVLYIHAPVSGADGSDSAATIADPGADISDTYFFPSPDTPGDVVAVLDVHPGIAAGQGLNTYFSDTVLYQMKFDDKLAGEAVGSTPTEDLVLQFSAGPPAANTQTISVYGPAVPNATGSTTTTVTQSTNFQINQSTSFGNIKIFAGVRADPYFFNTTAWYSMFPNRNDGSTATSCLPMTQFQGNGSCAGGFPDPGTNTQANTNVLSFVVEMPETLLTENGGKIAYWATTSSGSGM